MDNAHNFFSSIILALGVLKALKSLVCIYTWQKKTSTTGYIFSLIPHDRITYIN